MDVGQAIRDARRRAGLTQADLARRARTSQATLSAYETGRKEPSISTLERVLAAAGAQLTVAPGPFDNGRTFADVLDLAEALPTRHSPSLRYPRLR
ncbi:MAG TPA: helix-turn-helix transcriptional regulator [Solirubrobacteraceae bacterium]|jgi:hypothetical protein|nr:helix-turn-helix transcriptional regulator [Solirubrobacteraceae bacterium]